MREHPTMKDILRRKTYLCPSINLSFWKLTKNILFTTPLQFNSSNYMANYIFEFRRRFSVPLYSTVVPMATSPVLHIFYKLSSPESNPTEFPILDLIHPQFNAILINLMRKNRVKFKLFMSNLKIIDWRIKIRCRFLIKLLLLPSAISCLQSARTSAALTTKSYFLIGVNAVFKAESRRSVHRYTSISLKRMLILKVLVLTQCFRKNHQNHHILCNPQWLY